MKYASNNKGITMIALIITIIVLLILAGVTLAILVGNNGIIEKANSAGLETEIANEMAKIKMAYSAVLVDLYNNGEGNSNVTAEKLEDALHQSDELKTATVKETENADRTIRLTIVMPSGREYKIDETSSVSIELMENQGS